MDYNVECWSKEHNSSVILAVMSMILYVVGIPGGLFFLLWKNRRHLHDSTSLKHKAVKFEIGGLYLSYSRKYWYFEIAFIVYKMFMTGAVSVTAPGSPVQSLVAMFVTLLFLLVLVSQHPFASVVDNWISIMNYLMLLLVTIFGLVLMMDDDLIFDADAIGVSIISLSTILLAVQVGNIVLIKCHLGDTIVRMCSRDEKSTTKTRVAPASKDPKSQEAQQSSDLRSWH
eukprot:g5019.t1